MKTKFIILLMFLILFSTTVYAETYYDNVISLNVGEKRLVNVKYPESSLEEIKKQLEELKTGEKKDSTNQVSFIVENSNISISQKSNTIYQFKALRSGKTEVIFGISIPGFFVGDEAPGYETAILINVKGEENNKFIDNVDQLNKLRERNK